MSKVVNVYLTLFIIERAQHDLEQLTKLSEDDGYVLIEKYAVQELSLMNEDRALNQAIALDDSLMMNEDMVQLIQTYRAEYYQSQIKLLQAAYGEAIQPWQLDILTMLNGAFHEYSLFMMLDNGNLDIAKCAKVIATSVEASFKAFKELDIPPAIRCDEITTIGATNSQAPHQKAQRLLNNLKRQAGQLSQQANKDAIETCTLIENELENDEPKDIMLRALIANLAPYAELQKSRVELAEVLDVPLI
jgi:hypothetical protein